MKPAVKGLGVSQGKVKARVKIIKDIRNNHEFKDGDILVTRITNPTMVMLMNKAAGIICEIGGITSHPSIVSRELGIPCIVSAKNERGEAATSILKDGMIVEMNGETGEIFIRGDENGLD